ncbi:MAG: class I SAM-dependent methyltransferase, partial [Candidatus Odinarchaeota archaeon]
MPVLLNRMKAWKYTIKLGASRASAKEFSEYLQKIVILGLKNHNFLSFLKLPHTFSDIKNEFKVTDDNFLYLLLDTLLSDKTIEKTNNGSFFLKKSLDIELITPPKVLEKPLQEMLENSAKAVFNRLYHKFHDASSGFNLFVFEDALSLQSYENIRRAAISFVPDAIENPGRFLDLGCGSGMETADFWVQIMEKCNFQPKDGFKLIGIDINDDFINIANSEFYYIIKKYSDLTEDTYLDLKAYHPEFKKGTSTQIPFPNNYFDNIFISQVLHWTDLKASLAEMYSCLKPGGICFGTNILYPFVDPYLNIIVNTFEGAGGFFTKNEMKTRAKQIGFNNLKFCTPLSVF